MIALGEIVGNLIGVAILGFGALMGYRFFLSEIRKGRNQKNASRSFCTKCGSRLSSEMEFCANCGLRTSAL